MLTHPSPRPARKGARLASHLPITSEAFTPPKPNPLTSIVKMAVTAPAAPGKCPVADFVAEIARPAVPAKRRRMAASSARPPTCVDVAPSATTCDEEGCLAYHRQEHGARHTE